MTAEAVSPTELALRVAARQGGTTVIVVIARADSEELKEFRLTLESELEVSVPTEADGLLGLLKKSDWIAGPWFVEVTEQDVTGEGASAIEERRSRLRDATLILYGSRERLDTLLTHTPHLRSWIGGQVFHLAPVRDLTSERLEQLRAAFGMSDEQFLEAVGNSQRALEPHEVEWLALLGRTNVRKA